jgi:hypothetical protein
MALTKSPLVAKTGDVSPQRVNVGFATASDGSHVPLYGLLDANENIVIPAGDGVDGTGITPPTGASGIRGWLSGIYNKIANLGTAANPLSAVDGQRTPLGSPAQISVTAASDLPTAMGFAIPIGATLVYIQPESGDLKFTDDGSTPTTTRGMRIYAGVAWPYVGTLSALKLVSQSGAAVTVNLSFYK